MELVGNSPRLFGTPHEAAAQAAALAGVDVVMIHDHDHQADVLRLFSNVWRIETGEPVLTSSVVAALAHSGNYIAGAFQEDLLIGASVGFLGRRNDASYLHSHVTGVSPVRQSRNVGFALKLHQRAWAIDQGLHEIAWTFDPLVGKNGYFNITKLGAEIDAYHENFYGYMLDGINRGDESDRCFVTWRLQSERAYVAAEGGGREPQLDGLDTHTLLGTVGDHPVFSPREAPALLVYVPRDVVALRAEDPTLAKTWRLEFRNAFKWALARGFSVTGMMRTGCYVLSRPR